MDNDTAAMVERLREKSADMTTAKSPWWAEMLGDAASLIERQQARIAELESLKGKTLPLKRMELPEAASDE